MPDPRRTAMAQLAERVLCLEESLAAAQGLLAAADLRIAELESRQAQALAAVEAAVPPRSARKVTAGQGGAPVVGHSNQVHDCTAHGTQRLNTAGQCPKCFTACAQIACLGRTVEPQSRWGGAPPVQA